MDGPEFPGQPTALETVDRTAYFERIHNQDPIESQLSAHFHTPEPSAANLSDNGAPEANGHVDSHAANDSYGQSIHPFSLFVSHDAPNQSEDIDWRLHCTNVPSQIDELVVEGPLAPDELTRETHDQSSGSDSAQTASAEQQNFAQNAAAARFSSASQNAEPSPQNTPRGGVQHSSSSSFQLRGSIRSASTGATSTSRSHPVQIGASNTNASVTQDSSPQAHNVARIGAAPSGNTRSNTSANSAVRQNTIAPNEAQSWTMKKRIGELCLSERFADVVFLVGDGQSGPVERISAHRVLLASASPVFAAMFFGPLAVQACEGNHEHEDWYCAEGSNSSTKTRDVTMATGTQTQRMVEVQLPDMEPRAFRSLMHFVYEDACEIEEESCTQLLYGAKKYQLGALEEQCVAFLKQRLSIENAFLLLTQARLFDSQQLASLCYDLIDKRTLETMQTDAFLEVDIDTLCSVVSRDTLGIREVKLFERVRQWAITECERRKLPKTDDYCRYVLGCTLPSALATSPVADGDRRESQSIANSLSDSQANLQAVSQISGTGCNGTVATVACHDRDVLKLIRFTLMSVEEFANNVAKYSILSDSDVKNIFMFFLASTHNKPTLRYNDQPRRCMTGREQVAMRFCGVETRWGYSGTSDKIRFTVNRRIFVIGYGLFGSVHGVVEHRVAIQLIHADSGRCIGSNETTYRGDGSPSAFRVTFREPIEVLANTSYIASATISGPDSYFGTKGLRRVAIDSVTNGKVTFQFSYAAGCNNGTSVEDGQIPEIIFYV